MDFISKELRIIVNMFFKKHVAAFLCILAIWASFASCTRSESENEAKQTESATNENAPEKTTEPERENILDGVPLDLKFAGNTFTILSRSELMFGTEMGVEEENGDIVNDAIYQRTIAIEDRFGITIDVVKILGIWGNEASFNNTIRNSVNAGDNAYDLVAGYSVAVAPLAADGIFTNWKKVPHINGNAPWWIQKLEDELTIDGKLYFMTGDLSQTMIGSMMVFYFNKKLQNDYQIEDLYQTVLDGKWTYTRLYEISKSVYRDTNGDGEKNVGDTFGLCVEPGNFTDQMFVSMGQSLAPKGADGYPSLAINSPGTIDRLEKINSLFNENPGVFTIPESGERPSRELFKKGEALFTIGYMEFAENLRDMKDDFGIIPSPKYDESQEKYLGLTQDGFSLFCIPVTNERLDYVGAVTEAMAAESYKNLTPVYYETALKVKYSRDEVTSQMLDIIHDGIYFDFGYVNTISIGGIHFLLRELVEKNNNDFVSVYEKKEASYEKALEKLINSYKDLN
ncbi:MAG: ABC transporter substrate-binding protein [Oscillospiraceae bacterium]|nr:ABC transporter substrate-binding protein [Oscillospiraceae bacterium]